MSQKRIYEGGSYRVLSDKEISQINEASIQILEKVGFDIFCRPALELLEKNGADVDWEKMRVYIPRELVWRCIKLAPAEFVFYGREEGKDIVLGGKRVHFGTGGLALYVLDLERKKRNSTSRDIADIARLVDVLEHIDFYIIPVYPHDVPADYLDTNCFYAALSNTSKPVMAGVHSTDGIRSVIDIASRLAGGTDKLRRRPFVGFITSIISPLKIDEVQGEYMMEVARHGLPLATSTAPAGGATAPITLAGTLVQQNAESLMGVIISQLVNPGTPILYSAVPSTMDMRTMSHLMGSIENGLMNAAIAQMAHYYRLPSYITVGTTDSKVPDAQAAYESATTAMLAALAGGNFIHEAAGLLDGAMTASYAQYVIDNDILGSCLRALRGIEINEDTLALDVISGVGPGGNFLTQKHTLKYMRTESFAPRISVRRHYQDWFVAGAKDSWKNAEEAAQRILEEHHPAPIEPGLGEEIRRLYPEIKI